MAAHGETQCSSFNCKEEEHLLLRPKTDQPLRLAILEGLIKDTDNNVENFQQQSMKASEPEMVQCGCCGMPEECTPTYITRVKEYHCGKWVCGLCSEAVKELVKRNPALSVGEALETHMNLCMKFNRTIRINPKLSFASSMRDIVRNKRSQRRGSEDFCASKVVARTSSCGGRIVLEVEQSPISEC